jgi:hypothetical protein
MEDRKISLKECAERLQNQKDKPLSKDNFLRLVERL